MTLEEKAYAHKEAYPAFDLMRFLGWVRDKPETWQKWAGRQKTERLVKSMRSERSISRLAEKD